MMRLLLLLLVLAWVLPVQAQTLNGVWRGDRGGKFYLQVDQGQLYWYAEQLTRNPAWAHIFRGNLQGDKITGRWVNMPKGKLGGAGQLQAVLSEDGETIEIRTRNFVANKITKTKGLVSSTAATSPARVPASVVPQEDCIPFNTSNVQVKNIQGRWKLVDGSNWLFDFDRDRDAANKASAIIRHYHMDKVCYVGRPDPSFIYLLSDDKAPLGKKVGDDCVSFDPVSLRIQQIKGRWKLVDGRNWVFDFNKDISEAKQALEIIRRYQFRYSCFVGRPSPEFSYLRQ
jgi:hypothetical protein